MAVTVTDLALTLRITTSATDTIPEAQSHVLTHLLAWSVELVDGRAPGAPEASRDQAIYSLTAYVFDQPTAGRGAAFANAWANSGAALMLARWTQRRAVGLDGTCTTTTTTTGDGVALSDVGTFAFTESGTWQDSGLQVPATGILKMIGRNVNTTSGSTAERVDRVAIGEVDIAELRTMPHQAVGGRIIEEIETGNNILEVSHGYEMVAPATILDHVWLFSMASDDSLLYRVRENVGVGTGTMVVKVLS